MFLCLCKAVRVREVRELVLARGCGVDEVARCTGAGTSCGTCVEDLYRVVDEARNETEQLAAK